MFFALFVWLLLIRFFFNLTACLAMFTLTTFGYRYILSLVAFYQFITHEITTLLITRSRGLVAAQLAEREFENYFKDSGYWDYVLLVSFDIFYRVYWLYSLVVLSDFLIIEKSSWIVFSYLFLFFNWTLQHEINSLTELFFLIFYLCLTSFGVMFCLCYLF